jgi:hypothetical protein
MMPELVAERVAVVDAVVCLDCRGTLRDIDTDGSMSGVVGAVVPCMCVVGSELGSGGGESCGCHVEDWDENDGFTGWTRVPVSVLDDDGPILRPCLLHGTPDTAAAGGTGHALWASRRVVSEYHQVAA